MLNSNVNHKEPWFWGLWVAETGESVSPVESYSVVDTTWRSVTLREEAD